MKLEILLATFGNMKDLFLLLAIICFVSLLGTVVYYLIAWSEDADEKTLKTCKSVLKIFLPLTVLLSFVCCLPSVEDLWKVRLGLLKLELANPANVQKGAEEISRIAKKLECKYLGCEEEKK